MNAKRRGAPEDVGKYRIRAFADLAGVPAATLRAWERRYGVPTPARTAAAYRLYSDADVALVRSMRAHIERGLSAAEAAAAARTSAPPPAAKRDAGRDPFEEARDRIVDATKAVDPDAVATSLRRALTLGSAVEIYDRVVGPAARRIGDLWHDGQITVAGEHVTTQLMTGTVIELLRLVQPPEGTRVALTACFADEEHVLGAYGASLHLASWGFRVVVLGARTPPLAIARALEALSPSLVALSCVVPPIPARARELIDAYADACRGACWLVGGDAASAMKPWVEARGGLVVEGAPEAARVEIERAVAARRRARR